MATKREWTQDFILNARLNGGFNATFSKAQQEFSRLGKEIQSLSKVQSDISSYQKQQAAVENTRTKLENLQRQHDLLQKEIGETKDTTAGLERENVSLEQKIRDTTNALERQEGKLKATGDRLKEAGVDTENLSETSKALKDTLEELREEQKNAAEGAQTFGEKAASGFNAAGQALAAAGIAAAVKELTEGFAECVGVAGDFEAAMSTVEALSQAGAQEMAALSAEAKELGATTKFTAKESADAMGYMAMAGWDATDMLQGMNGVLQLAAASGEDLAMVSDIVTDSLSAFGLTAADTTHFSDVLAAAATNSNTNVSIMGETFKMSASVAGALGYSIEDVAAAMGLMANSGVKGSIAGTALRNTFNGLLEGVTLTGTAFGEYEYSAVRADGTMKSFGATIEELRERFEQMTEAERVSNAQAIAGQRGYNGLLAILNATDADYQSLTNSINNCTGAAERMARIRMDNLNGQLTLMNSAWDALKTTIGEQFLPELRGLAEAGTDTIAWVDSFIQDHPALTKGVMAFTGVMGGAAVSEAEAEINEFTAAVDSLTGAVEEQAETLPKLENALEPVRNELDRLAAAYNETYEAAVSSIEGQYALWDKAEKIVPTSAASVNKALESQAKYWRDYNQNIQTVLDNAGDIAGLNELLEGLDAGDKDTVNFVAGLAQASKTDKKALEEMVKNWQEAKRQQEEAAASFSEYASGLAGEMDGLQEELVQSVQNMDLSSEAAESARATIQAYIDQAEAMKGPLRTAYAGLWQSALDALNQNAGGFSEPLTGTERRERGYASGTRNAAPGMALVGEEGPELVLFGGGERVLNATETAGLAARASLAAEPKTVYPSSDQAAGPISVQFSVLVEGNASPETVESFRTYVEGPEFRDRVREVFAEEQADAMRRAMW